MKYGYSVGICAAAAAVSGFFLLPAGCRLVRGPAEPAALAREAALRREAAARPRRILFNNDGGDARVRPEPIGIEELLAARTAPLVGSQVDTILYDTTAGSFGSFAHRTQAGEVFLTRAGRYRHNITPDLVEQGTDPLQVMIDFSRRHGFEIFWVMRMNDTHDANNPLLVPDLKREHPELLFGAPDRRPPHGTWSGMDYAQPLVRELAFRYIEEVAENYAVDGIHLDFFRHTVFFRSVAWGGLASPEERDALTALMRRVRARLRAIGAERDRPILLSIRTPDDVAYCEKLGIDLEHWLAEGLVDLFVPGGYFRLRPWRDSVELARRNGVRVYPDLSETRVGGGYHAHPARASLESYRGRAAQAWEAGADGVHIFNMFRPDHPMLWEIGDPHTLAGLDKTCFVSIRGAAASADPRRNTAHAEGAFAFSVLTPDSPLLLDGESETEWRIDAGEDFEAARALGLEPEVTLLVSVLGLPDPSAVSVRFNGRPLSADASAAAPVFSFPVPPDLLHRGPNRMALEVAAESARRLTWEREAREGNHITLTRVVVSNPEQNRLRLCLAAETSGTATVGSYSIRTVLPVGDGPVPPGFRVAPNGYAYPERWTSPGFMDNGPLDENPEEGVFCITLPMDGGEEGDYVLMVGAQNRPAPGPYQRSDRNIPFRIDAEGRVLLKPVLKDIQLLVRYRPPS